MKAGAEKNRFGKDETCLISLMTQSSCRLKAKIAENSRRELREQRRSAICAMSRSFMFVPLGAALAMVGPGRERCGENRCRRILAPGP